MSTLAILGGTPIIDRPLRPFNTIGAHEVNAAIEAMRGGPLSGFLGGELEGGKWVRQLEEAWCEKFKCKHAVSVNSATSGLSIAVAAVSLDFNDVYVPALTMSATAVAGRRAGLRFVDVEPDWFCIRPVPHGELDDESAIIAVNLFGHPAELHELRERCDDKKAYLIEDNAQAILAKENGKYTGTIGHVGVFSLNVHKHIQAGEGGIVVTDSDEIAHNLKLYRNHGELYPNTKIAGYNLRMTEVTAAIAYAQLSRIDEIVAGRIEQANYLTAMTAGMYPFIKVPKPRVGCEHVYYHWPFLFDDSEAGVHRDLFIKAMNAEGVPLIAGYTEPLHKLQVFDRQSTPCWTAKDLHYRKLGLFSNCQWTLSDEDIKDFADAFDKVSCNMHKLREIAA